MKPTGTKILMWMAAAALACGLSWGGGDDGTTSSDMQVEEPGLARVAPPILPDQEHKDWKANPDGLTQAQKDALKERQDRMKQMISLIQEKRKAIQAAKPEDKAALARELHSLILEKSD